MPSTPQVLKQNNTANSAYKLLPICTLKLTAGIPGARDGDCMLQLLSAEPLANTMQQQQATRMACRPLNADLSGCKLPLHTAPAVGARGEAQEMSAGVFSKNQINMSAIAMCS